MAAARAAIHGNKAVIGSFPRVQVVLQKPGIRAVDYGAALLMLQKHTHHGGLRHKRMHPAKHMLKLGAGNHFRLKAGPVMVVNACNAPLDFSAAKRRSIYGEVAPFGMPARAQAAWQRRSSSAEIRYRILLRRHNRKEAHVEILLPANERSIRAAKSQIGQIVFQKDCKRRKLLFRDRVQQVYIAAKARAAKTAAFLERAKQARILCQAETALRHARGFRRRWVCIGKLGFALLHAV